MSHDNEPEQKLCTVIEIRYKCEVLFETQLDEVVNDADLFVETDLKSLPVCSKCKRRAIYHKYPKKGLCQSCMNDEIRDMDAAVQQMYDIGYW